jgi:hypothetical protein
MKNLALAAAVSDLAALLDYAGHSRTASSLRDDLPRIRRAVGPQVVSHIRGGIFALKQSVPSEAREAAGEVVARIRRVMN